MSVCDNCGVDSNLMLVVKLKDESFHYFLSSKALMNYVLWWIK